MKIINSEFKKDENDHFEGKILVCNHSLDYIQQGLLLLLEKPYNFADQTDLTIYNEIQALYNDVFMLWEATTPRNSKDVDILRLVTEDGQPVVKEGKSKDKRPLPDPNIPDPVFPDPESKPPVDNDDDILTE